jgi:hypothetical protein
VKNRLFAALAAATLCAPAAHAVILDTSGYASDTPPPPPEVTCTLGENDITVTSFADILGYRLKGSCKVSFPGTGKPPAPSAPYEGGGSWNPANGMVNEFFSGRDAKGQLWEIRGGGTCKLDPWMTGIAAASCSGAIASATPNAPKNLLKSLKVPISAGVLDAQARGWLTGRTLRAIKNEHQAPVIVKPTEGQHATLPLALQINPGPDSPTKTFALEWQAKVNGAWTPKNVTDQAGFTASLGGDKFGGLGEWRVRARAHQTTKASWSGWRSFTLPALAPPACANAKPYGATYDASAMPSSMNPGITTKVTIKVTNGSNQNWGAGSSFHLSYHWAQGGNVQIFDGERTFLPADVAPCQTAVLSANVKTPPGGGAWQIQWDMVNEGVSWFSVQGVPTGNKDVTIGSAAQPAQPAPAKK